MIVERLAPHAELEHRAVKVKFPHKKQPSSRTTRASSGSLSSSLSQISDPWQARSLAPLELAPQTPRVSTPPSFPPPPPPLPLLPSSRSS
eukprot:439124-Rhodomonas_salina.1